VKFYRVITNADGCQTLTDRTPDNLLKKNLYTEYTGGKITCIVLDYEVLKTGVKQTDFLSNHTLNLKGHIVSDKVYRVAKDFNLLNVQFADIIGNGLDGYKFMFFNSDLTDKLDYVKSDFKLIRSSPLKTVALDTIVPPNRSDVLRIYMDECSRSIFKFLRPQNGYVFKADFNIQDYDAFRIGHFDLSFYISERLKNKLEENGITGCAFGEETAFNHQRVQNGA